MANTTTSFGFLLPTREILMAHGAPDFRQIVDLVENLEKSGFLKELWKGEVPGERKRP